MSDHAPMRDRTVSVTFTPSGRAGHARRSLSDLRCTLCGATIPQGTLYTQQALALTGTLCVTCVACRPFQCAALVVVPDLVSTALDLD